MKTKDRIDYIDVLRGIAIVLMIMGHIGFSVPFDKYIHCFHMPIWFFISGYFFRIRDVSIFPFIKKRIVSLLFPYLFWGIGHYLLWILISYHQGDDIFEPLVNLFWYNTNDKMPIAGALWFLTSLFWTEIIAFVLMKIFSNKLFRSIIILIISLAGCVLPEYFEIRLPWALDCSFVGLGFLYFGKLFKDYSDCSFIQKISNLNYVENFLLILFNAILCFANGYINMRKGSYGFVLLFWVNALTAIIAYWNLTKNISCLICKYDFEKCLSPLKKIGSNSIIYLCLNQLVILVVSLFIDNSFVVNYHWIFSRTIKFIIVLPALYGINLAVNKAKLNKYFGLK